MWKRDRKEGPSPPSSTSSLPSPSSSSSLSPSSPSYIWSLSPRQLLKWSFFSLLMLYVLYVLLFEVHSRSYVWQSTVLADFIYSDVRTSCNIEVSPIEKSLQKKLNIAIINLYSQSAVGEWGEDIMKRVMRNRLEYAKMHDYSVINANEVIDRSRPVAWSKLLAIKDNLPKYDYIMYIDMDAVIMEPSITIESLIYATAKGPESDIIIQSDWNGPNTGIFLAKNTQWTIEFLKLAWDQQQLVAETSSSGISHPFEYEQRAFHYLLDTEVWKSRGLPTFGKERSKDIEKHFTFLPQCAMNSYTLHPLDFRHMQDRKKSQYIDGDFIIHFAGKKGAPKMNLLRHYLDVSENRFTIVKEKLDKEHLIN